MTSHCVCGTNDFRVLLIHAGLLMMSLEPLELRDHHLAGRDQ
jgi:hypothetical protein